MKGSFPLIILGVLIVGGLALAGQSLSSKVSDKVGENLIEAAIKSETGGQANVNVDDGSVTVTSDDGTISFGGGTSLPNGFPTNVPTPDNATLTGSFSGTEDEKTTYSLVYTVTQNTTTASEAYQTELKNAGFTVTSSGSASTGGSSYSGFEATKDTTNINVAVAGDTQQTTLTIVVVTGS